MAQGGQTYPAECPESAQPSHCLAPGPDPGTGTDRLSGFPPNPVVRNPLTPAKGRGAHALSALFVSMLSNTEAPTRECGAAAVRGSCWDRGRSYVCVQSWGTAVFMQPAAGPTTELGQQGVRPGGGGQAACGWRRQGSQGTLPPVRSPQGAGLVLLSAPGVSLLRPLLLLQPSEASELHLWYN